MAEFERAGDAERIARRYGVTTKSLKWWRWRLRAGVSKLASGAAGAARPARAPRDELRLLPVVVTRAPEAEAAERDSEPTAIIETSRGRISIRGALSADQLVAVVAELVRGC